MEKRFKLTVIIPVYNQEELILRALYSIPNKENIQVVIVNDGSTDQTREKVFTYLDDQTIINRKIFYDFKENKGVSNAVNTGLQNSYLSEYTVLLGSDDYFLPEFEQVIEAAQGQDLVYFNLRINNGDIFDVTQQSKENFCGSVKLMRSDFISGLLNDINRPYGEDYYFFQEILKRKPIEKFTRIVAKHYNFPREGSLSWRQRNNK